MRTWHYLMIIAVLVIGIAFFSYMTYVYLSFARYTLRSSGMEPRVDFMRN